MKKLKSIAIAVCMASLLFTLVVAPASLLTGCKTSTSAQTIAYQSLASIGAAVNAAESAYNDLAVKGLVTPAQLAAVGAKYNDFQVAYAAAITLAQGNANAVAPTALVAQGNAFIVSTQVK
jgi:3-deoxy-D-manno-octulosonate 8-phosphate phosphatase KdsC-like HAD superfamily phosphatase